MADRRRQRASQDSSEEDESDSPPGSAAPSPRGTHRLGLAAAGNGGAGGGHGDAEKAEAAVEPVPGGASPADSECVSSESGARPGKAAAPGWLPPARRPAGLGRIPHSFLRFFQDKI